MYAKTANVRFRRPRILLSKGVLYTEIDIFRNSSSAFTCKLSLRLALTCLLFFTSNKSLKFYLVSSRILLLNTKEIFYAQFFFLYHISLSKCIIIYTDLLYNSFHFGSAQNLLFPSFSAISGIHFHNITAEIAKSFPRLLVDFPKATYQSDYNQFFDAYFKIPNLHFEPSFLNKNSFLMLFFFSPPAIVQYS